MRPQDGTMTAPVTPWAFIAAILLPPLGVFLIRGMTPAFWLTVVMTLAGYVPGVIIALILIVSPRLLPIR
jgi:uncharacterized membrane protein YqaE (UPF0057 family)